MRNRAPGRETSRRERIWMHGKAYTLIGAGGLLYLCIIIAVILTTYAMAENIAGARCSTGLAVMAILQLGATVAAAVTVVSFLSRILTGEVLLLASLPLHTSSALPAREVLVRGSDAPALSEPEVLLRPAAVGEGTQAEQLLRV